MEWLSENWLLALFIGGMLVMHFGGHRGGGKGGGGCCGGGKKVKAENDEISRLPPS